MPIGAGKQTLQNHKTSLAKKKQKKGSNRRRAGVAQLVEQLICNQQVAGSSPFASSPDLIGASHHHFLLNTHSHRDGFPSGQREQTVNLSPLASMVRIHPRPRMKLGKGRGGKVLFENFFSMTKENEIRGSSSVGRAPAFQAGRRGFETRLPLSGLPPT